VEAVVAQGKVIATCLRPSDTDNYAEALAVAMESMEDPFDGGWVLLELMFLSAAKDGGRVLLSGAEGEAAVGAPTNYIRYLLRQGQWRTAWREARGFSRHYYRGDYSSLSLYLRGLRSCLVSENLHTLRHKLTGPIRYRRRTHGQVISRDFALRVNLVSRLLELDKNTRFAKLNGDMQLWHQHVVHSPHMTAGIERYERLASYAGVEVRHPLLDLRLLEFSIRLPWRQKVREGWSKWMLRGVASKTLPPVVAWREGWEEIGWKFTAQQARLLADADGFPLEHMKKLLVGYVSRGRLERCLATGLAGGSAQLADSWDHHQLCLWLRGRTSG
jgi:asparagine synthase (glutamine-hydrolysing)